MNKKNDKLKRFVMGWSDEDQAEEVVYARNQDDANALYASGEFELE